MYCSLQLVFQLGTMIVVFKEFRKLRALGRVYERDPQLHGQRDILIINYGSQTSPITTFLIFVNNNTLYFLISEMVSSPSLYVAYVLFTAMLFQVLIMALCLFNLIIHNAIVAKMKYS